MNGTPIHELRNSVPMGDYSDIMAMREQGRSNYEAAQNLQYEQSHNASHAINQNQHDPYATARYPTNTGSYQAPSPSNMVPNTDGVPQMQRQPSVQEQDIADLARDISDNLPDTTEDSYIGVSEVTGEVDDDVDVQNVIHEQPPQQSRFGSLPTLKPSPGKKNYLSFIPEQYQEAVLVAALFVLLSQPKVQETIRNSIKQTAPGPDGQVSQAGVVIYGVILAALYHFSKMKLL